MELQQATGGSTSAENAAAGSSNQRTLGCFHSKLQAAIFTLAVIICLTIIIVCVCVAVTVTGKNKREQNNEYYADRGSSINERDPTYRPSSAEFYRYFYNYAYRFAGVSSSEKACSTVGTQVLAEGGSAVDSLISISLCLGAYRSASSGIGGGGFMNFYSRSEKKAYIFDYRERAGIRANATMYDNPNLSQILGGGSIATPGEVAGLWKAHLKFGKLSWGRLFEPSIKMLDEGIILNDYMDRLLKRYYVQMDANLRAVFSHEDGTMKQSGDTIKMPELAETYRRIARDGMHTYYNGTLLDDIIEDLEEIGDQVLMRDDFEQYEVAEREPVIGTIRNGNFTMISPPPPSSGAVLQYIMKILDGYNFSKSTADCSTTDESRGLTYHRIVEAWKFAYASRSQLGDEDYINNEQILANITSTDFADAIRGGIMNDRTNDLIYYGLITDSRLTEGTSHASIIAANGDAAAFTTSINRGWGSKRMGTKTGIIFNDLMDDFSFPDKPSWTDEAWTAPTNRNNWIVPKKRPLSSMSPTIVLDKNGDVRLVTGGSGGSKIITATSMTMINNLWLNWDLFHAVSEPRLHHQLLPNQIQYEEDFPEKYLDILRAKGHKVVPINHVPVSDSVSKEEDIVYAVTDSRRLGGADGY